VQVVSGTEAEPLPAELEVMRGQTVIGATFADRVPMILTDAELSELILKALTGEIEDLFAVLQTIVASVPDNATIVDDIHARRMEQIFVKGVTTRSIGRGWAVAGEDIAGSNGALDGVDQLEHQLFIPALRGR
jgi:hypothetical protein